MATVYAGAQQEHLVSVLVLEEAGQHRDAWVISRSMIEGMAQLTWAMSGDLSGCTEWYGFLMVESWRQMKDNKANGRPVDPTERCRVTRYLRAHGQAYFSDYANREAKRGRPMPDDPYRAQWNSLSAWDVFKAIDLQPRYRSIYVPASGWLHWNPLELIRALEPSSRGQSFTVTDPRRGATGVMVAIASLIEVEYIATQLCRISTAIKPLNEMVARLNFIMNQGSDGANETG